MWRGTGRRFGKIAWPSAATVIALLALVVSIVQFAVTAPMLTQFYVGPKLVVSGKSATPKDKILFGHFIVANDGNAPATKIELGFIVQLDQRLTIAPNFNANIFEQKDAIFFKNVRVEVERLAPKEKFVVMIFPGPANETLRSDVAEFFTNSGMTKFPVLSFVRSAEGPGKFVASEEAAQLPALEDVFKGPGKR